MEADRRRWRQEEAAKSERWRALFDRNFESFLAATKEAFAGATPNLSVPDYKECPECAEDVKAKAKICRFCNHEFEIDAEDISLEANLYEDLDLDSIDAVDLVVKLREITGKKIEPDAFKQVRTVQDVVSEIEKLVK